MNYNDGAEIELDKFDQTAEELGTRFGGVTVDTREITGYWFYEGTRYQDRLVRLQIDTDDSGATAFLKRYKEVLKERFQQLEIWITVHTIEIL